MPLLLFCLMIVLLLCSVYVLYRLCIIDLRERILPNVYVLAFALLGLGFHSLTWFHFEMPFDLLKGAALGGGILYAIRMLANWHYKQDALGLGDVKLMAAAGLWLGSQDVLMALSIGACAGLVHGLGVVVHHWRQTKEWLHLGRLQIPAGPGFIAGIVLVALLKFQALGGLFF